MATRSTRRALRPVFGMALAALTLGASATETAAQSEMTFSEVAGRAELIAVGAVAGITHTWDADREAPFTDVIFTEVEVLKGATTDSELTLRFLGGPAPDGYFLSVAGMPQFAVGERAVVFVAGNGAQVCPLVGWTAGLYRLLFDAGQDVFTVADHAGRPLLAIEGGAGRMQTRFSLQPQEGIVLDALTLPEFRNAVQAAAR